MNRSAVVTFVVLSFAAAAPRDGTPPEAPSSAASGPRPLVFEENRGQTDASVRFLARTADGTFFVTPQETALRVRDGAVRSRFVGSAASPRVEGEEPLAGRSNYFLGNDPQKWVTDVPTCARVRCRDVYPGIDVVWHGADGRLEYDVVVAPGADPSVVEIALEGADDAKVDPAGDLVLACGGSRVVHRRPFVYQESDAGRVPVASRYVLDGDRVRFDVADYDRARTLVIDPVVEYSSYLGAGGNDIARDFVRDAAGNTFVCGMTTSTNYPNPNAIQAANAGRYDAFVTKIDPAGTSIVFSTYLGGGEDDDFWSIALDGQGNLCMSGDTFSGNFPTTAGAYDTTANGLDDAVAVKVAAAGNALVFSTYLGSQFNDVGRAVAADAAGAVYVATDATTGFPSTPGTFQPVIGGSRDLALTKLAADGKTLVWSTFVGGTIDEVPSDLVVDANGNSFVTGYVNSSDFPTLNPYQATKGIGNDAFVVGVNATGTGLLFSTYLGGSNHEDSRGIALGPDGHVYVCGITSSDDLATLAPIQSTYGGSVDVLFAEFTAAGAAVHVSYLGGSKDDVGLTAAVDPAGRVWLGGTTGSTNFPRVDPGQPSNAGDHDAFYVRLGADHASLEYASYLGGAGSDSLVAFAFDADGNTFGLGQCTSTDFPVTPGALQAAKAGGAYDGFIATAPLQQPVDAYFLPKKVKAKENDDDSAKSTLQVTGYFDMGGAALDLTHAATIKIGSLVIPVSAFTAVGTRYRYEADGLFVEIVPNPYGSSRAKFRLKRTGDLTGVVPQEGDLVLRFKNDVVNDGRCNVAMTRGSFQLGRTRGSLLEPNLFVVRSRAKVVGGGADSLSLVVGLATGGKTPAQAPDVKVGFGALTATITGDQFTKSGDRFVFAGDENGVTNVTLDYAKETIAVKAKNADLGAFDEGGNSTKIVIGLGTNERSVTVRTSKTGTSLRY